ncbi:type IV CRISPR-associated protein Csf1 [Acidovorax sp.]|uniref:type IV CRISPR-associated protein Csf1 n=1 Tax=Acidovorax sp. TaxID=1872122 RepID=UPI00391F76A7
MTQTQTKGLSLTSSVVVVNALGMKPEGAAATSEGICAMCALHIGVGDLQAPTPFGQNFTDDLSLAARGSPCVCGYCATLSTVDGLRASGFGVFSKSGVLPFRKWQDIANALLNPPEPPFVMTYATANSQHMGWRAPVSESRNSFMVRVGLRDLLVRREMLERAVDACELLGNLPGVRPKAVNPARRTLPNPFVSMSSDLKEPSHGRLHPGLFSDEARNEWTDTHEGALALLRRLSLGESWALRFVLTPGAGAN